MGGLGSKEKWGDKHHVFFRVYVMKEQKFFFEGQVYEKIIKICYKKELNEIYTGNQYGMGRNNVSDSLHKYQLNTCRYR